MSIFSSLGSDFGKRVLTAAIGAPIILIALILGSVWWLILALVASTICIWELHHMISPKSLFNLVAMLLLMLLCFLSYDSQNYAILVIVVAFFLIIQTLRAFGQGKFSWLFWRRNALYIVLSGLYIGLPFSLLPAIRGWEHGLQWTVTALINNWSTDSLALIGGRLWGKHKLVPRISPGKTLEGAITGFLFGCVFGLITAMIFQLPLGFAIIVNVAVAIFTELGDLLESWIKRFFAVKDASQLLPGHGGVLDRADGALLMVPVLYWLLTWFYFGRIN